MSAAISAANQQSPRKSGTDGVSISAFISAFFFSVIALVPSTYDY